MTAAAPQPVRLGVIVPVFEPTPVSALRAAEESERAGLDGVFCYDHLWPLGSPGQPAIAAYPLLGVLAVRTTRVAIGTLVARVGLASEQHLLAELITLDALSEGRMIAGIGTGDSKNAPENLAYGIEFASAAERQAQLERVGSALVGAGITTWIGAGEAATNAIARHLDCPLNLWAASTERVANESRLGPVTWAGNLPRDREDAASLLSEMAAAGARWIVVHWPGSVTRLLEAADAAGIMRAPAA